MSALKKRPLAHRLGNTAREWLLETRMIFWLTQTSEVIEWMKEMVPEILALFCSETFQFRDVIARRSAEQQRWLLRRGLIHLLPICVQRALLSGALPDEDIPSQLRATWDASAAASSHRGSCS